MHRFKQRLVLATVVLLLSAGIYALLVAEPSRVVKKQTASFLSLQKVEVLEGQWNSLINETNNRVISHLALKKMRHGSSLNSNEVALVLKALQPKLPHVVALTLVDRALPAMRVEPYQDEFHLSMMLPLNKELSLNYAILVTFSLAFMRDIIEAGHGVQLITWCGHKVLNYNTHLFNPLHTTYMAVVNRAGRIKLRQATYGREVLEKVNINNTVWYLRYIV